MSRTVLEQRLFAVLDGVQAHFKRTTTDKPIGYKSVLEAVRGRPDKTPDAMMVRRQTVEHVFRTFTYGMGYTQFLTRRLADVGTQVISRRTRLQPDLGVQNPGL
jgi:hypothetical protein